MRAIEISHFGGPEVLVMTDRPQPTPKDGEVLIRVVASGVNRPDVLQRAGHYPVPAGASDLPGLEVAGEIIAGDLTGENHFNLKVGDVVCALVQGGGYAEYCTAPLAQCLPVPKGWTALEAASIPETYFTVWSNVFQRANLGQQGRAPNEVLLVQGGTSGIGVTAIQLANALGFRVLATAGNDEKCRVCELLGAERGINYKTENFVEISKALTDGRGVDVVLDMVAGSYVPKEIECLADDGRLAIIALLGGAKAELDFGQILRRRLTVTGSTLRPRPVSFKAVIAQQLHQTVWPLMEQGEIKPVIYQTFPVSEVVKAHQLMESSQHIGKIMLDWTAK